jgi:hypothetical protein
MGMAKYGSLGIAVKWEKIRGRRAKQGCGE